MYENIEPHELLTLMEKTKINLIDVRDLYEFYAGHVDGAVNIPLDELLRHYENYLNKNQKYYFICKAGVRSASACSYLSDKGFHCVNVLCGVSAIRETLVR